MIDYFFNYKERNKNYMFDISGTLGDDLNALVYKHLHGIRYTCTANVNYPDFGHCEVPFGRVSLLKNVY